MATAYVPPQIETVMETRLPKHETRAHFMNSLVCHSTGGDLNCLLFHNSRIDYFKKFNDEFYSKNGNLNYISELFVCDVFNNLFSIINTLRISKFSFEISFDNSIVFTAIENNSTFFIEQHFDESDTDVFLSQYKEKELVSYSEGDISEIKHELVKLIYNSKRNS